MKMPKIITKTAFRAMSKKQQKAAAQKAYEQLWFARELDHVSTETLDNADNLDIPIRTRIRF